nr:hypothetical protein NJLGDECI_00115 [Cydia pomonella granulovirus]
MSDAVVFMGPVSSHLNNTSSLFNKLCSLWYSYAVCNVFMWISLSMYTTRFNITIPSWWFTNKMLLVSFISTGAYPLFIV